MFVSFNIEDFTVFSSDYYYQKGVKYYDGIADIVEQSLEAYITVNDSIDAASLMDDWFPEIEADVFISHSHNDEKKAISLAGWLHENFGLNSFVDSCVWGYCNKLLKQIDIEYCDNGKPNSFSYESRNYSTAHVHVMLMNALTKMIDRCEVVFFLNSENASYFLDDIKTYTLSPWIFNEIEVTRNIQMKVPQRPKTKCFSADNLNEDVSDGLKVSYQLTLDHMIPLKSFWLNKWINENGYIKGSFALDSLYEIKSKEIKQLIRNHKKKCNL